MLNAGYINREFRQSEYMIFPNKCARPIQETKASSNPNLSGPVPSQTSIQRNFIISDSAQTDFGNVISKHNLVRIPSGLQLSFPNVQPNKLSSRDAFEHNCTARKTRKSFIF